MRYSKIRRYDVANGPGIRVTIFVTGCTHNCEDCFNKELQDFSAGDVFDNTAEKEFFSYIDDPMVVGVNILGGEPLQQIMDDCLQTLLAKLKDKYPEKDVWLWTGDILEVALKDEKKMAILEYVDVLIDGPFVKTKRDIKLKYRGSSNQRVINLSATKNNVKNKGNSFSDLSKEDIVLLNMRL